MNEMMMKFTLFYRQRTKKKNEKEKNGQFFLILLFFECFNMNINDDIYISY